MEKAYAWLAIAGDTHNTVPKEDVTPAEVALLTAIHGDNAVFNIEILDTGADIAGRTLLQELAHKYGRAMDRENRPVIRALYPTPTSPVPQTFAELGLAEEQFTPKSLQKMGGHKGAAAETPDKPLDKMTKAELVGVAEENGFDVDLNANKPDLLAAILAALAEADGVGNMPPSGNAMG